MSIPVRELIIRKLATRTKALRRLPSYDDKDLPVTHIQVGEDSATNGLYGMTEVTMPVTIARAISMTGVKGDDWHSAQNKALADLIKETFTGGDDLDGLASGMQYVSGDTDLLTDAATGVGVAITVTVRYAWVHGNPYSQDADTAYEDPAPEEPAP
jgi:hypothetical protein